MAIWSYMLYSRRFLSLCPPCPPCREAGPWWNLRGALFAVRQFSAGGVRGAKYIFQSMATGGFHVAIWQSTFSFATCYPKIYIRIYTIVPYIYLGVEGSKWKSRLPNGDKAAWRQPRSAIWQLYSSYIAPPSKTLYMWSFWSLTRYLTTRVSPVWLSILSKHVFGDIQAELKKRLLYSIYDHMVIYATQ